MTTNRAHHIYLTSYFIKGVIDISPSVWIAAKRVYVVPKV